MLTFTDILLRNKRGAVIALSLVGLAGLVLLIAGFPGVMSLPAAFFAKSNPGVSRIFQWIAIVCLVVAAGMVAYTCLNGYYDHMESMANFKPIYAR